MEAANQGAFEGGGTSYGLKILLPHEQASNPYVQKSIDFNYFFARKVMLIKYSCAFVVMPGGLGTLHELFEAATLIQCQKLGPFPLVLMGAEFWKGLQIWGDHLVKQGVFEKWELGFGRVTDSPQEAAELNYPQHATGIEKTLKDAEGGISRRQAGPGEDHPDGSGRRRGIRFGLFCADEEGPDCGMFQRETWLRHLISPLRWLNPNR